MKAQLLLKHRIILSDHRFAELVLWQLPESIKGSVHNFKYRLAFVVDGNCIIRYDNESGKGDHKHLGDDETAYIFESPRSLLEDFWRDIDLWSKQHE